MICYDAQETETGRYWYHYDGLGSVVALSDSSGSIVEGYPERRRGLEEPGLYP